jgi:hypothetical protein
MSDVIKGVLGGGWSLLVGWILPTCVNVVIFAYLVAPDSRTLSRSVGWLQHASGQRIGLTLVIGGLLGGLILAALQTPLYRVLEGYVGWWPADPDAKPGLNLLERSRRRQLRRKQVLLGRLDLVELTGLESAGKLEPDDVQRLAEVRADQRLTRYAAHDAQRTASQLGLLRSRLQRFPVDDGQLVPTRLGNAIRRLEEYGYDRYRLDMRRLWYELTATAPQTAVKQIEQARTTVDFMVAMLLGDLVVAIGAVVVAITNPHHRTHALIVAAGLVVAARFWYAVAVRSTDNWASAVRALINIGRAPLASSLGLRLPDRIADERRMWRMVASLVARPYHSRREALDEFRAKAAVAGSAQPEQPALPTAEQPDGHQADALQADSQQSDPQEAESQQVDSQGADTPQPDSRIPTQATAPTAP